MTCFLHLKIYYAQGNNMISYNSYYNVQQALKFKISIFFTLCLQVFHIILTTTSDYFSMHH